ncbi:dynamin-like GTPase mgm1 [Mortierella polycephala]|uniref:dynamin GTPase n=1 Tax=Mortierella polycephala TaxID=41804 RepID=A0A9P6QBZ6_9FUNG|nr:dynamin-like GTPase mgm1 [Mortierella polycephala]
MKSIGRMRLLSVTSGSRLVSRAFSTAGRPASAINRPFAIPRRHSAFRFDHIRKSNLIARRGIAASAAPRFVMHALRLPMGALTASLAGLSYAQYKVTELSNKGSDWAMGLAHDVKGLMTSVKSTMNEVHLPELSLPEFLVPLLRGASLDENSRIVDESSSLAIDAQDGPRFIRKTSAGGDNNNNNNNNQEDPQHNKGAAAAAAVAAAAALAKSKGDEQDSSRPSGIPPHDGDFMLLTKKLIEVRNVLNSIDHNDTLKLPSIVVIGSQSSGKSSVLEAIVGHEFLPKGSNMVTRRPIELTLIHTPHSKEEYGEFPTLGLGKVHDFKRIQQTLKDLNMAVPESECVSSKPIELRIYSPNIPDLTLIDLPGYIQITSKNQPLTLKEKISELCEKYIQEPNIILAVCAADVDLANSEALRSSRKVDPLGLRTIGVITKMDLVDPDRGVAILKNHDYPLHLGYIGVVCKAPANNTKDNITQAVIKTEDAYFRSAYQFSQRGVAVGTGTLRRKLMDILEENMGSNLGSIIKAVQKELDETRYQFKVEYNDQKMSAESYVAESVDKLKHRFKDFSRAFGKPQVRLEIRHMLEQRMLDICAQRYWSDPRINELAQLDSSSTAEEDRLYWDLQLDLASSALTKSGVGRQTTQRVVDILSRTMEQLAEAEPFNNHPEAAETIKTMTHEILSSRSQATADQVENTIKPYKYEVECTDGEWTEGVKRAVILLQKELEMCEEALVKIKTTVGTKKLRKAINFVIESDREEARRAERREAVAKLRESNPRQYQEEHSVSKENSTETDEPHGEHEHEHEHGQEHEHGLGEDEDELEAAIKPHFNPKLLIKAREALSLRDRALILKYRLSALKSKTCKNVKNKTQCPEAFLAVVSEKLAYTSVMFIQVELMNEFVFQLPRMIDSRLGVKTGQEAMERFARENPSVGRHLELMDKRVKLEEVWEKLNYLVRRQEEAKARRW